MNIVYMGTGEIGLPAVERLIAHPAHHLAAVFTQPDKPAGRKLVLTPPAIKKLALEHGVPVFQPPKIRAPDAIASLEALDADVIVVMAYGQILPGAVFEAPSVACINLHASLLPKFRGAAPIQAAIREGERESGLTVIYIDEGLDSGDVLLLEPTALDPAETGQSLHDRLAALAPAVLDKALDALALGTAPRTPQDHASATHSPKLAREDGHLDWARPAEEIERTIRAYHPWPGTFSRWSPDTAGAANAETILKIFPGTVVEEAQAGENPPPGTVVAAGEGGILVSTGDVPLRITELQLEGRRRMTAADFLRGHALPPGSRFH